MPKLLRDSFFVLEHYAAPAFVRLARTAEPLASQAQVERSLQACKRALGDFDTASVGILFDWRLSDGPDAHEDAAVREAQVFGAQFARAAVLLLTAAAPSNVWAASSVQVFRDEEAAIAFVSGT